MTVSRRALLGFGIAAIGSLAAGCGRVGRAGGARSTMPIGSVSASTAVSSGPAPSISSAPRAVAHRGAAVERAFGPRTREEVALTFHGAGDPRIVGQLLRIFAEHGAKVTVLAVGTWLELNPTIAREISDAGHELGNHTYRHLDIDSLAASAARMEIVRCRDVLVSQLGAGGRMFRQSQSRTATALVRRLAGAAGYPVCLSYDIDSLDYTDPGPAAIRHNVASARPGSIVSMHFGHAATVSAMPYVLGDLASRGLQPVTASTLLRA